MSSIDEILAVETPAFARAAKAIVTGDTAMLREALANDPSLVRARSAASHHATLLHYVSANGIESELQSPVANSDEVAAILLAAGADIDAPCDAYDGRWATTMELLVSSDHPTEAGVAGRLVDLLCSAGAVVDGVRGDGSPLATALCFATLDCVAALIARGARTDNPIFAAAAGRIDWLQSWFDGGSGTPTSPVPAFLPLATDRVVAAEQALVFACMCGQTEVVRRLLDRGVNVNASPPAAIGRRRRCIREPSRGRRRSSNSCSSGAPIQLSGTRGTAEQRAIGWRMRAARAGRWPASSPGFSIDYAR